MLQTKSAEKYETRVLCTMLLHDSHNSYIVWRIYAKQSFVFFFLQLSKFWADFEMLIHSSSLMLVLSQQ